VEDFSRGVQDDKSSNYPRIGSFVQVLGFGDHSPLLLPSFTRPIRKFAEHAGGLARLFELHFGFLQLPPNDRHQPFVLGQTEHKVHLVLFAPAHQGIPAEAAIPPQDDLHLRPLLPDLLHDTLHFFHCA